MSSDRQPIAAIFVTANMVWGERWLGIRATKEVLGYAARVTSSGKSKKSRVVGNGLMHFEVSGVENILPTVCSSSCNVIGHGCGNNHGLRVQGAAIVTSPSCRQTMKRKRAHDLMGNCSLMMSCAQPSCESMRRIIALPFSVRQAKCSPCVKSQNLQATQIWPHLASLLALKFSYQFLPPHPNALES